MKTIIFLLMCLLVTQTSFAETVKERLRQAQMEEELQNESVTPQIQKSSTLKSGSVPSLAEDHVYKADLQYFKEEMKSLGIDAEGLHLEFTSEQLRAYIAEIIQINHEKEEEIQRISAVIQPEIERSAAQFGERERILSEKLQQLQVYYGDDPHSSETINKMREGQRVGAEYEQVRKEYSGSIHKIEDDPRMLATLEKYNNRKRELLKRFIK